MDPTQKLPAESLEISDPIEEATEEGADAPISQAPGAGGPDTQAFDSLSPGGQAPDAQTLDVQAFDSLSPDGQAPDGQAPDAQAVDSLSPDSLAALGQQRPSYRFFGIVAALSLIADITTKVWAEVVINQRGFEPMKIVGENISITLAYNQGGAWGLFAGADEMVRKPFFLGVSAFAVFFIISLYSRLHPTQRALKWGLPLVLGGALGNLSDRITRSQVIDFIDYRGDWVMSLNSFVHKYFKSWAVTDHWPTFNVADVAICIGVGLMAVDMFTHRPKRSASRGNDDSSGPFPHDPLDVPAPEFEEEAPSPDAPASRDSAQPPSPVMQGSGGPLIS